jgi:ring-1,2-phenylacetyl-CoA epoxidase subunit PaaD
VTAAQLERARALAGAVPDPEIPVVSIAELGILRGVEAGPDGRLVVTITPTYSGCPAMETICADIAARLGEGGFDDVEVRRVLAPAWTTDWISDEGRRKLRDFGIAPPARCAGTAPSLLQLHARCPRCGSLDTRLVSRFGSTACKAHHVCNDCLEPFDGFKAI